MGQRDFLLRGQQFHLANLAEIQLDGILMQRFRGSRIRFKKYRCDGLVHGRMRRSGEDFATGATPSSGTAEAEA